MISLSLFSTENYKLLDKEYLKGKKNILITQENSLGKDYDFAIYKPEDNQLLLLQSKIITKACSL